MTRSLRLDSCEPTPLGDYLNRRKFITMAAGCGAAFALRPVASAEVDALERRTILRPGIERPGVLERFPATRNEAYNLKVELTDALVAGTHNNFYEFLPGRAGPVWKLTDRFEPDPWHLEVVGRCRRPARFDIDQIFEQFAAYHEERTYHFRCVETWAMDLPWTGFELNRLLNAVEPYSDAAFVRFVSVNRPDEMPGIRTQGHYPWPYFEGLRMDEAMHPLTLLATGVYGQPLPRQHGAPFRIIVPWKYGYKSPKSIVRIELLPKQPPTFWNTMAPNEYSFLSNVNPNVPHPRWSQAREHMLGTGQIRPTRIYAGYGPHVAHLYKAQGQGR